MLQQELTKVKSLQAYLDVIDKQKQYLTETLRLGEDILSKAHQEAVPVMKKWLLILQQRIEDVDAWAAKFEKNLQVLYVYNS